jgi:hypothetical protein
VVQAELAAVRQARALPVADEAATARVVGWQRSRRAPGVVAASVSGGDGEGGGRGQGGGAPAAPAGPRKIAEGVYVITNGYRTIAIEMKDGIVLVDAPQNGTPANITQAKEAIPKKSITHVITTHLHMDHVGGLRTVLADGDKEVTLVTKRDEQSLSSKSGSAIRARCRQTLLRLRSCVLRLRLQVQVDAVALLQPHGRMLSLHRTRR